MKSTLLALFMALGLPASALAQNWMLVEARSVPHDCTDPIPCIRQSQLVLRNMLYMQSTDRAALLQFLNRVATIRGLPERSSSPDEILPSDMTHSLHPVPIADKFAPLVDHPGVYFDSAKLDENEETSEFSSFVRQQLRSAGVNFLTKVEMENTPGRPSLSIRFSRRLESEGCIVPFTVSMSVSEEVVMVRNPAIKLSGNAWSGRAKENLANSNYTPHSALKEVVQKFIKDWRSANPA